MVDLTTQLRAAETSAEELRLLNEELTGSEKRKQEELHLASKELELYK